MNMKTVSLVAGAVIGLGAMSAAHGAIEVLNTNFGPEAIGATGTGSALFTYDDVARTLRMQVMFSGLSGTTTVAHIHAPTAAAFTGTAGVTIQPPSLTAWPTGVNAGSYDRTFDLSLAGTWNSSFVTANGGTTLGAETALMGFMRSGRAYFNIHTSTFGGGEIRGFVPAPGAGALLGLAGLVAMRRRR
jgi:hypothetical protein